MTSLLPILPVNLGPNEQEGPDMALFSNANRDTAGHAEPVKPFTRFKRVHMRDAPEAGRGGSIDPTPMHSRAAAVHHRSKPVAKPISTPVQNAQSTAAALHATDPIPLNIFRKALPLRAAQIAAREAE